MVGIRTVSRKKERTRTSWCLQLGHTIWHQRQPTGATVRGTKSEFALICFGCGSIVDSIVDGPLWGSRTDRPPGTRRFVSEARTTPATRTPLSLGFTCVSKRTSRGSLRRCVLCARPMQRPHRRTLHLTRGGRRPRRCLRPWRLRAKAAARTCTTGRGTGSTTTCCIQTRLCRWTTRTRRRAIHSKNPAARATEVLAWSVGGCEDGTDESATVVCETVVTL